MASDFSRTLALLRREKKISQRTAAGDLGVSQALLSHYENGLREPGLSFVVRAADYYGVSCDYLLGRSMARDGSAVPAERMDISVGSEQEKSQILNAAALLLELAEATGSEQLPHEIEAISPSRSTRSTVTCILPIPAASRRYSVPRTTALIIFATRVPENTSSASAPPRAAKPATASPPRSFSVSRSPPPRSANAFRPCRATF